MKIFWLSTLKMLGLFWWLAWERPTDGSRGRVGGRHASPRVRVVRRRGWLELVKLLHGDTSVYLQIHFKWFLNCYHRQKCSHRRTILTPELPHLLTTVLHQRFVLGHSQLFACVWHFVVCVGYDWLIDETQGLSRLLQRGGARKTLQRWESRWFGKHFKQKNSNAYRPQYKSFSAGVDTWWRSTSWQAQN